MNDEPRPTRSKRRFWIAVLIIAGCMIATTLYYVLTTKPSHIPFDSERWKDASFIRGVEIRQMMLLDLERNVLHRGMTRDKVESLLGDDGLLIPGDHDMAFALGRNGEGAGSMNRYGEVSRVQPRTKWLTLTFNDNDQLVDWQVITKRF